MKRRICHAAAGPFWGAVAAVAFSLLGLAAQAAGPKDATLSSEDKVCLDCHAKPGLVKTLANGQKLSLVVPAKGFAQSVHNSSGCEGCHSDIDLKGHVKEPKSIASKRAFALEQMETCRDCHKKTVKQYDDSVHSALVRTGSDKAPLCSDCHDPHATRSAKEKPSGAGRTGGVPEMPRRHRHGVRRKRARPLRATRRWHARTATRRTTSRRRRSATT